MAGEPPVGENGEPTGPVPVTVTTLLSSDPRKVTKVRPMRAYVEGEEEKAKKAMKDGNPAKRGAGKAALGFFPWDKAGWLLERATANAQAHRGENHRAGCGGQCVCLMAFVAW